MDAKPEDGTHHCTALIEHAAPQHVRTFQTCKTHPGHEQFMTVDELKSKTPSDLGMLEGDTEVMEDVWNSVHRTVRVVMANTSTHRPATYPFSKRPYPFRHLRGDSKCLRYGSGFLCERLDVDGEELGIASEEVEIGTGDEPCPCPECKTKTAIEGQVESKRQQSYYFVVITATHCVFDKDEAQHTTFELFYDSEDRTDVRCLYGVTVLGEEMDRVEQDRNFVVCVTHDSQLADKLSKLCVPTSGFPIGILVSHPHGLRKRISLGKFIRHKCVLISENNSFTFRKGTTVRFSNCPDVAYILKCINRRLGHREPTIGYVQEKENKEGDGDEKSEKRKFKTKTSSSPCKSKQTLKLLCDVTVSHDELGISAMSDIEGDYSLAVENPQCQWWTLPSGIRLATTGKGNKHYTLPEEGGGKEKEMEGKSLTMEVFLPGVFFSEPAHSDSNQISSSMSCSSSSISSISSNHSSSSSSSSYKSNICGNNNNSNDNGDDDDGYNESYGKGDNNNGNNKSNNNSNNNSSSTSGKQPEVSINPFSGVKSFFFSTYDMASCPGCSGAMVHSRYHQQLTSGSRGVVHFGLLADNVTSTSGLNTLDRLVFT